MARREILEVPYRPAEGYGLDVELFTLTELWKRAASHVGQAQRATFHLVVLVTHGRAPYMIDFVDHACAPGSVVVVQPGQVQRFVPALTTLRGWLLIFRPALLGAAATADVDTLHVGRRLAELAPHRRLAGEDRRAVTEALTRMARDTRLGASATDRHALLRHQISALIVRLHLADRRGARPDEVAPVVVERYRRYREAVERDLLTRHHVQDYARLLGCSAKSLSRATQELAGLGAQQYLARRRALEAQRLLAHTSLPVAQVADRLGFDEATNFVKFFRREAGCTPTEFRRKQGGPAQDG